MTFSVIVLLLFRFLKFFRGFVYTRTPGDGVGGRAMFHCCCGALISMEPRYLLRVRPTGGS